MALVLFFLRGCYGRFGTLKNGREKKGNTRVSRIYSRHHEERSDAIDFKKAHRRRRLDRNSRTKVVDSSCDTLAIFNPKLFERVESQRCHAHFSVGPSADDDANAPQKKKTELKPFTTEVTKSCLVGLFSFFLVVGRKEREPSSF